MVDTDIPSPKVPGNSVSSQSYVYVIAAGDEAVKIGIAGDPRDRLRSLQTGSYKRLVLAYSAPFRKEETAAAERICHVILEEKRAVGEWFSVTVEEAKLAIERATRILRGEELLPAGKAINEARKRTGDTKEDPYWRESGFFPPAPRELPGERDIGLLAAMMQMARTCGLFDGNHASFCTRPSGLKELVGKEAAADLETFDEFSGAVLRLSRFWINFGELSGSDIHKGGLYPQMKVFSGGSIDWPADEMWLTMDMTTRSLIREHGEAAIIGLMKHQIENVKEARSFKEQAA